MNQISSIAYRKRRALTKQADRRLYGETLRAPLITGSVFMIERIDRSRSPECAPSDQYLGRPSRTWGENKSGLWCRLLAVVPFQLTDELRAVRWPGSRT